MISPPCTPVVWLLFNWLGYIAFSPMTQLDMCTVHLTAVARYLTIPHFRTRSYSIIIRVLNGIVLTAVQAIVTYVRNPRYLDVNNRLLNAICWQRQDDAISALLMIQLFSFGQAKWTKANSFQYKSNNNRMNLNLNLCVCGYRMSFIWHIKFSFFKNCVTDNKIKWVKLRLGT